MVERASVYIDGYNLYFGLDEAKWRKYLWLDIPAFAASLLAPNQDLVSVKYFTTRLSFPEQSRIRQNRFLDALAARGGLEIIYGNFIYNDDGCNSCSHTWQRREEKQTDVNIAVHMLLDAYEHDAYDVALLVSGDSDLVPAVRAVRSAGRRVVVATPPKRVSQDLNKAADHSFPIWEGAFKHCQMPYLVPTNGPYVINQPYEWTSEYLAGS